MANKYTTLKNLEGYKTLDLNEHITIQQNKLSEFKQQFNGQTSTDEKFFKAKEDYIKQQQDMIDSWIKLLGVEHNYKTTLDVHLMVSESEETA